MRVLGEVLEALTYVVIVLLLLRAVVSWVMAFAHDWHPAGPMVILLEVVFTVTDPPLRALRRVLPPLRVGNVSLDLGFILLFIVLLILAQVVWPSLGTHNG
jgi:YggT family protein